MIILQDVGGRTNPMLPVVISQALHNAVLVVRCHGSPKETRDFLDRLVNTGTKASMYKLSIKIAYCKAYPHHVKEIVN